MLTHHTKHKGDIGLTIVIADLTKQEWIVSLPIQEHARYDLIATKETAIHRIQVKYRTVKNGAIEVPLHNTWGNSKQGSVQSKIYSSAEIDYFAVTDGNGVAYLSINELQSHTGSFMLRVTAPKNSQLNRCRFFRDYSVLPWLSGDSTCFV